MSEQTEIEKLKLEFEQACRELDNEIAAKDERIASLEAAIKPFAGAWSPDDPGVADVSDIEVDHYRTASQVLKGTEYA